MPYDSIIVLFSIFGYFWGLHPVGIGKRVSIIGQG